MHISEQNSYNYFSQFLIFIKIYLDDSAEKYIQVTLLDRFLACMKPASITIRLPCAGVFFVFFKADIPNFLYYTGLLLINEFKVK